MLVGFVGALVLGASWPLTEMSAGSEDPHDLWARLLTAHPSTSALWIGNEVPPTREDMRGGRTACPGGSVRMVGDALGGVPLCDTYWSNKTAIDMVTIGVGGNYQFEQEVSAPPIGARVYAFDPTRQLRAWHEANAPPGVTFSALGLGSDSHPSQNSTADAAAESNAENYGEIDPLALRTLTDLYAASNLTSKGPDVLKIDCEGCEWPAFEQIARETPDALANVKMVQMEVHLTPTLNEPTPDQFDTTFSFLTKKGFKLYFLRMNHGFTRDRYLSSFLHPTSLPKDICCYELGFVRA